MTICLSGLPPCYQSSNATCFIIAQGATLFHYFWACNSIFPSNEVALLFAQENPSHCLETKSIFISSTRLSCSFTVVSHFSLSMTSVPWVSFIIIFANSNEFMYLHICLPLQTVNLLEFELLLLSVLIGVEKSDAL